MALACDIRIASDNAKLGKISYHYEIRDKTSENFNHFLLNIIILIWMFFFILGLVETRLAIIPGAGGTQRLGATFLLYIQ